MKEGLKLEVQANILLGNFIGTLEGIICWDIPKELKVRLKTRIEELKNTKIIPMEDIKEPIDEKLLYITIIKTIIEKGELDSYPTPEETLKDLGVSALDVIKILIQIEYEFGRPISNNSVTHPSIFLDWTIDKFSVWVRNHME